MGVEWAELMWAARTEGRRRKEKSSFNSHVHVHMAVSHSPHLSRLSV